MVIHCAGRYFISKIDQQDHLRPQLPRKDNRLGLQVLGIRGVKTQSATLSKHNVLAQRYGLLE
jgi:hypothetical protein